jgi:hypothetical protein
MQYNQYFKSNIFKDETVKKPTFDLKTEEFPNLSVVSSKNNTKNNTKKYSTIVNITAVTTVTHLVTTVEEKIYVPPGWVQYIKYKSKYPFTITVGEKTCSELTFLEGQQEIHYIPSVISQLSTNWDNYKTNYDKLHGQGAYDDIYFSEPIYPSDEYNSDSESEPEYSNDTQDDYNYEYWDYKK